VGSRRWRSYWTLHEYERVFTLPLPCPDLVNVAIECTLLRPSAGWTVASDYSSLLLQGELCNAARAGSLSDVTVVQGCPTITE
jgi:hypothetical protein